MPPATEPVLDDLTEPERFLVMATSRGEAADLKRHKIRGSVLRDLVLGLRPGWVMPEAGLRLHKVIVEGGLDLEGCSIAKPLLFWHSRIESGGDRGAVVIRDARLKRLGIHSCTVDGAIVADRVQVESGIFLGGGLVRGPLQVRGAEISGALAIEGTEIGDGKQAILAAGLRLTGPIILRRAQVRGELAFPRAQIGAGIYAEDAVITREGQAINGESAQITGDLLLDRANIMGTVRLSNARVGGEVSADGLVVAATPDAIRAGGLNAAQGLNLSNAKIGGSVWLDGAEIGKIFRAEGVEIWGGATAISADVIRVGGNWTMRDARLVGVVNCPGADIAGQFRLTGAQLSGSAIAIRADGARIRGGCYLSRANVSGLLRFPAADIGNQFRLRGATLKVEQGPALLASASNFSRDVELSGGFSAAGAIVLDQCRIRGLLDLKGSALQSAALARIGRAPAPSDGVSALPPRYDTLALSLVDAEADRIEMPRQAEDRPRGIVDLSRVHAGSYLDFAASWPPRPETRGRAADGQDIDHLVLDGFVYENLSNPSGVDGASGAERVGERRIAWLQGEKSTVHGHHFRPQAWVQLANRLAAQGYEEDAREVTIARLRRERKSGSATAGQRWQGRILDLFALYGYNPWRTVTWMFAVVLLCAGIFGWAANQCAESGCTDESVYVVTNRDAYAQRDFPRTYPTFHALAYSFDVFVPFVAFGYEDHWRPNIAWAPFATFEVPRIPGLFDSASAESRTVILTLGGMLYLLVVLEIIAGLVLSSLAVTGFTGLLRDAG